MKTIILLFQCADQKGIVARVSDFIFRNDGNIIEADQHSTDPEGGHFFLRIEFCIAKEHLANAAFMEEFKGIAHSFHAEWHMYDKENILRMGIFVSKPDHCLADLLYLVHSGELRVRIPFIASNHGEHRELVEKYGIPFHFIPAKKDERHEEELLTLAKEHSDFLVLARYMLVFSGDFLQGYNKDMINIHHSFLPSFKGANPYKQAFDRGVKVIGATAHFVTEALDEGPIIAQMVEPVSHRDSVESLIRKGKNLEKRALSQAVHNYIDYRIIRHKNKTIVF
jgi:formyltetrahydrofolate deformylase